MPKTTVVNINKSKYDVYIGRGGHGKSGYFGNPYHIGKDGNRDEVVAEYKKYFLDRMNNDVEFALLIQGLRGKKLGCFCSPKLCHGDIIVEYLERTMKVLVCGDRNWTNAKLIKKRLLELPCNTIIIEGGATGADTIVREVALEIGLEVVEFPAAWKKYGKSAGIRRNIKMLDTKPHLVLAFHDNIHKSKGTKHTVGEARKRGIDVEIIDSRVRDSSIG